MRFYFSLRQAILHYYATIFIYFVKLNPQKECWLLHVYAEKRLKIAQNFSHKKWIYVYKIIVSNDKMEYNTSI